MSQKPMSSIQELKIIVYPDPRLKKVSQRVEKFDDDLAALVERMFDLMREAKGVGLAAPQVGVNLQVFVMNPTGKPEDDRVYINPNLSEATGEETAEEGCLSLPEIRIDVCRSKKLRMEAKDLKGQSIVEEASGYPARIWQHEFDHLVGTMLTDRMGPVDRLKHRKAIKELEEEWEKKNGVKGKKSLKGKKK
jgi:peptide deformylase